MSDEFPYHSLNPNDTPFGLGHMGGGHPDTSPPKTPSETHDPYRNHPGHEPKHSSSAGEGVPGPAYEPSDAALGGVVCALAAVAIAMWAGVIPVVGGVRWGTTVFAVFALIGGWKQVLKFLVALVVLAILLIVLGIVLNEASKPSPLPPDQQRVPVAQQPNPIAPDPIRPDGKGKPN